MNQFFLKRRQDVEEIKGFKWADVDHKGRIIATKEGCLYASKQFKDGSIQLLNLEMLHDLNAQKPSEISIPNEMKRW